MEQVKEHWPFAEGPDTAVVTTKYVTEQGMPVLQVSREIDEDGELWQFHCGNDDYRPQVLLLVALHEILAIDPTLSQAAALPVGWTAKRRAPSEPWVFAPAT